MPQKARSKFVPKSNLKRRPIQRFFKKRFAKNPEKAKKAGRTFKRRIIR